MAFLLLRMSGLLLLSIVVSCGGGPVPLQDHVFRLASGEATDWSSLRGAKASVLITLDPECPFCQGYAPVIDSLADHFAKDSVRFIGFYPTGFIHADSVLRFASDANLDFAQVMDRDCAVANMLHARVTPECFLLNEKDQLVYRGAIDDWAVRAGSHKPQATRHYLSVAIAALLAGQQQPLSEERAVGCIVECPGADQ